MPNAAKAPEFELDDKSTASFVAWFNSLPKARPLP